MKNDSLIYMKMRPNVKRVFWLLMSMCLVMEAVFLYSAYKVRLSGQRSEAKTNGEGIVAAIQSELQQCEDTTELLEDLYLTYGKSFLQDFDTICPRLLEDNLAIGSMYFAPDAVIGYAYPDTVEEATRNFRILDDPVQGPKARQALDSGVPTIAGPHELIEGGCGFIIRNPVFVDGRFEGFTIMVVDTDLFLQKVLARLDAEEQKYNFALWKADDPTAVTNEDGYILTRGSGRVDSSVTIAFEAPNDIWYIAVEPAGGWSPWHSMIPEVIISVVLLVIGIGIIYLILRSSDMSTTMMLNAQEAENRAEMTRRYYIVDALSRDYLDILLINFDRDEGRVLKTHGKMLKESEEYINRYSEIWNMLIEEWVPEEDRQEVRTGVRPEFVKRQLAEKEIYTLQFRMTFGGLHHYQAVYVNLPMENGEEDVLVLGIQCIDNAIAQEMQRNEQLARAADAAQKANAAKTSFLSRMSHDIRTPLNGIIGLLELDGKRPDDKEYIEENRKKALVAANHLLSLINDVLQMSKMEDGSVELAHEPVDLGELTRDVLTIISMRASDAGVTMEYVPSDTPLVHRCIYGSSLHLRQIFLNIYSNAIKYNKVGGRITSRFREISAENGRVIFQWTVTDTGIGMSPEFQKRLFEPFSQEHIDARSVYKGTGLGMSIVKGLIDKMEGDIRVDSQVGEGTTFTITIPFDICEEPVHENEAPVVEDLSIEGMHLLMAEDNELNAEIAQAILEEAGARVTTVMNGREAVDLLVASPAGTFDVILMDIMMPVMDGITATRAIRQLDHPDAATIPILAMTANAFDEDARRCLEAGMNMHLSKPLDISKVIAAIASCR